MKYTYNSIIFFARYSIFRETYGLFKNTDTKGSTHIEIHIFDCESIDAMWHYRSIREPVCCQFKLAVVNASY